MKLYTYLNYGGNCELAFRFYEQHLGGKISMIVTHAQQPDPSKVPVDWKNAILHARTRLGDMELMGADIPPDRFQPIRSAYLTLIVDSVGGASVFMDCSPTEARYSCLFRRRSSRFASPSQETNSALPG